MRRAWGVLVLAVAVACFAAVAFAGPNDPEVTSTHTVSKDGTTAEFCITVNSDRLDGKIFDVEFLGSWIPGVNAPEDKFKAPQGWSWEPVGSGGWRAYNGTTPMAKGTEYCFTVPLAPGQTVPNPVNLIATDQGHNPIHNFLSTPPVPPAENGIKHAYWLGPNPDGGQGSFANIFTGCGDIPDPSFPSAMTFRTPKPGVIVIRGEHLGTTTGRVYRNHVFHARGAHSGFDGAFNGRKVKGEYRSTTSGCLDTYSVTITLDRPGKVVATCPHSTVEGPRRALYGDGDLHLRLGLACGPDPLAGKKLSVYVVDGKKKVKLGSLRTKRKSRSVVIHLDGVRPDAILVRFQGNALFDGASRRIPIAY